MYQEQCKKCCENAGARLIEAKLTPLGVFLRYERYDSIYQMVVEETKVCMSSGMDNCPYELEIAVLGQNEKI